MLTGCNPDVGGSAEVSGTENGIRDYKAEIYLKWQFGAPSAEGTTSDGGSADAALASYDLSESSVEILSSSGSAILTLELLNGTFASNTFGWVKQGESLVFADPSAVNSWASKYWDDVYQLTVDIPKVQTTSEPGSNLIVSETRYNGGMIFGDTVSWYDANVINCDPTNPGDHLCQ